MPDQPRPTTRRAALGWLAGAGGVVLWGLAGCSADDEPQGGSDPTTPSGTTTATSSDTGAGGADDAATVRDVIVLISAARAEVKAVRAARPGLRSDLAALQRLHESHAETLGGLDRSARPPKKPPESDPAARERVGRAENELQRQLVAAAVEVDSGGLAATLAAMAAAVAQQRSLL